MRSSGRRRASDHPASSIVCAIAYWKERMRDKASGISTRPPTPVDPQAGSEPTPKGVLAPPLSAAGLSLPLENNNVVLPEWNVQKPGSQPGLPASCRVQAQELELSVDVIGLMELSVPRASISPVRSASNGIRCACRGGKCEPISSSTDGSVAADDRASAA